MQIEKYENSDEKQPNEVKMDERFGGLGTLRGQIGKG